MSEIINKAIIFATEKHADQVRKQKNIPFIMHPMEVAVILSGLTEDENTIAAGLLHDTVEDTDATLEEIQRLFGDRVCHLVAGETEDKMAGLPKEETWELRKIRSIEHLKNSDDIESKKMWLADKLSNIRSIHRDCLENGDEIWTRFNQKDKSKHGWYYRTIADNLKELEKTEAYKEYCWLLDEIFEA